MPIPRRPRRSSDDIEFLGRYIDKQRALPGADRDVARLASLLRHSRGRRRTRMADEFTRTGEIPRDPRSTNPVAPRIQRVGRNQFTEQLFQNRQRYITGEGENFDTRSRGVLNNLRRRIRRSTLPTREANPGLEPWQYRFFTKPGRTGQAGPTAARPRGRPRGSQSGYTSKVRERQKAFTSQKREFNRLYRRVRAQANKLRRNKEYFQRQVDLLGSIMIMWNPISGAVRGLRERRAAEVEAWRSSKKSVAVTPEHSYLRQQTTATGINVRRLYTHNLEWIRRRAEHYAKTTTRYKNRTGRLRRGTFARSYPSTGRIILRSSAPYWPFVEFGTERIKPRKMFQEAIGRAIQDGIARVQQRRNT